MPIFRNPDGATFGRILDRHRGIGPGFDLLRLGLAVLIVIVHCNGLTGNGGWLSRTLASLFGLSADVAATIGTPPATMDPDTRPVTGLGRPFTLALVPAFFALSGFLVTGSAYRVRELVRFLGLRVIRIVPALTVEVVLSAIVLGAVFTTLPLSEYYSSAGFWNYFRNIVGDVHFFLPGVFEGTSTSTRVNSNLWTLPPEFQSYLITSALIVTGLLFRTGWLTALFVISTLVLLVANIFFGYQVYIGGLQGPAVVYHFFMGMMAYIWKDKIPYHFGLFAVVVVVCYVLMLSNRTVFIYPALLTYITIFIGLSSLPQIAFLKTGDYSYGIYLYGYPVTQSVLAAAPSLRANVPLVILLSLVLTALFSYLSWHLVEKHAIKLKVFLSKRSATISAELHAVEIPPDALSSKTVLSPKP